MAGQRNSRLCTLLLVALIAVGSVGARELQQQDVGNTLGGLINNAVNTATQVANQVITPVINATRSATAQAANATGANSSLTNTLANLGQALNITNRTSANPLNMSLSPVPGNGTDLGQTVINSANQFVGNLTTLATNLTSGLGNRSGGLAGTQQQQQQQQQNLTPPWQNGAGGRAAAGTVVGFVAGAVVLLQLVL